MSDDVALAVEDLRKTFGGVVAVDGVSFEVPEGSITGLIGPNGAGKSTTFDLITGVVRPDAGDVRLRGRPIGEWPPHRVARAGVGRTFQTPKVFAGMTVRENLAFAATGQTGESVTGTLMRPGTVADEEAAVDDRVAETLDFLDLAHLADEYARGLSGGQRKLLELGRVLMLDPEVVMLDEPVAGVNPTLTERLLERLHELKAAGRTLVVVEHDVSVIMDNCDEVVVMHDGDRLATGPPAVVRTDDAVVEAYLGGVRG